MFTTPSISRVPSVFWVWCNTNMTSLNMNLKIIKFVQFDEDNVFSRLIQRIQRENIQWNIKLTVEELMVNSTFNFCKAQ